MRTAFVAVLSYLLLLSNTVWAANPTVTAFYASTEEDTAVTLNLSDHASDADGDAVIYYHVTKAVNGRVTVDTDTGLVTFTPIANYNGSGASFYFAVKDATNRNSVEAQVSITVNAVNDTPTASAVSVTTYEDVAAKTITFNGNDNETTATALTYSIVTSPSHGSVSVSGNQAIYKPSANYNGPDSFTYKASDGSFESSEATVSMTINALNDRPTTTSFSTTVLKNVATVIDLTPYASDIDGDTLSYYSSGSAYKGSVSIDAATGQATFTPTADYSGSAAYFKFYVRDPSGFISFVAKQVSITVNSNTKPVASSASATLNEDASTTITLSATDADGDALTYAVATIPTQGSVSLVGNVATYTPTANVNGADTFTFTANDGTEDSVAATVSLNITAVNDAPTVSAVSATVEPSGTTTLILNAIDVDGDALTYNFDSTKVTLSGSDYVYAAADEEGADNFTYTVCDAEVCESGAVTIEITDTDNGLCFYKIPEGYTGLDIVIGEVDTYWIIGSARRIMVELTIYNGVTETNRTVVTSTDDAGCYFANYNGEEEEVTQVDYYAMSSSKYVKADGSTQNQPDEINPDYCDGATWDIMSLDPAATNAWGVYSASFTSTSSPSDFSIRDMSRYPHVANKPIRMLTDIWNIIDATKSIGFLALDTAISSMEVVVCSADPDADFGRITISEETSGVCNNSDYGCYQSSTKTILYGHNDHSNLKELIFTIAHEFGHHLQYQLYTMRDWTIYAARLSGASHSYSDLLDGRIAFTEGFADGFGNFITEEMTGSLYVDLLSHSDPGAGINMETNVGYVFYQLMKTDGYGLIHDVYKLDMPTTPVFQTLHSFGYYYNQAGGSINSFVDVGIPAAALDDLYDDNNEIGQALGDFFALYPRITYRPPEEDSETITGPDFGDGPLEGQRLISYSYDISYSDDYETLYEMECMGGDTVSASLWYNILFFNRTETFCDDLTPHYNAFDHDLISFSSNDTHKETSAGASRWYTVDGNQFQISYYEDHSEVYLLPFAVVGDSGDTGSPNPKCTVPLNIIAYKDGEKYTETSGLCPMVDISENGTYIVEVYSTDITTDVSCFSIMDNFFCGSEP